jgi:long-chain fatty acid transport protein
MGNFGWQNWRQFGEVDVTISSDTTRRVTSDAHLHDTWHGAIGAQHRFFRSWVLSAGLSYDSSAVSKFHRTPSMPFDDAWRYGVGLQYDWSKRLTVAVAYEFLDAGEAEIANLHGGPLKGALEGKYSTNEIHFIAMNIIWKF